MGKADFFPVSSGEVFDIQQLRALEHVIEGEFDSAGNFQGRITAFGKDRGKCFVPSSSVFTQRGKDSVGPFKFCLGTFEQNKTSSTHSDEEYEHLATQVDKYGGICIHRDGLRVMPYGREDGDLFRMEFRRSKHAGREFFSYRRCIGRLAITSKNNPNLKDKAGREGLVDNKARREFERLVIGLLMYAAREYFGTSSSLREQELPGIQKARQRQMRAAETARKRNQKNFTRALKEKLPLALEASTRAEAGADRLEQTLASKAYNDLPAIKMELDTLQGLRDDLRIPNRPDDLGTQEEEYRKYRDAYASFCATIDKLKSMLARCEADGLLGDPKRIATSKFYSNEARISSQIGKALSTITSSLDALRSTWEDTAREDRTVFRRKATEFVNMLEAGQGLTPVLDFLDKVHTELSDELNVKYDGIINSLEQLVEGVDLEGAFLHADEANQSLEKKVAMLNAVAQLGISVEIIGHELEALESQVTRYLKLMPKEVRALKSYSLAFEAHRALVDRLRFLAPLRKTAYRSRIRITGEDIAKYVRAFFDSTFEQCRITFEATPAFEGLCIRDLPSRIYPTFINLVNNALYWVQRGERRIIRLDFVQGKAIVADSGPGVDADDQEHLFELFFTKRFNGRGVGLYLCRENLAVARHCIRYATCNDPKTLEGANFIIEFNEVEHVSC
ncbi:ATP-binding protein [Nitratidesulfovibrio oxamicus]|uniref:ATP-binding protein n=1 Tax=Nitratidesulfovibrio oxamicus TaxID=32016 RepID=UPI0027DE2817|nr:ATP-binding protein [Nitratidesulfovibrio oxamicus]